MNIIRFLKGKEWIPLYFKELKNRTRRDKNLSDLNDIAEARKNLGLVGEVDSHTHDDMYLRASDVSKEISATKKVLEDSIRSANLRIDVIKDSTVSNLKKDIDTKLDKSMIYVGDEAPAGADDMIWFCTKPNNVSIKTFRNNKWLTAGAVWPK